MITLLCRAVPVVFLRSTTVRPNLLLDLASTSGSSGSPVTESSLVECESSEKLPASFSIITLTSECPCSLIEHLVRRNLRDFFDLFLPFFPSDFSFPVLWFSCVEASRFLIIADSSERISRPSLFHVVLHLNKSDLIS